MTEENKNTEKQCDIHVVRESLSLGNFTINKPEDWALDEIKLEIRDYDYDSTKISVDDLKALRCYIDEILNSL
tara:strand:- start:2 stop:220 length:219 start_codon:yes stop_codon:yes gene_type:complete